MLPLGLCSILSVARHKGFCIDGFDFGNFQGTALDLLNTYENLVGYDLVGLSFYNVNADYAFDLAHALKERAPEQIVVAGGAHPSSCPREVLDSCSSIDFVIKGEGEEPFAHMMDLLVDYRERPDFSSVPGIVWRLGSMIVDNGEASRVEDLDSLPPPCLELEGNSGDLVFFDRREVRNRRAVAISTSRSCPYNCSFCAIILIGRKWRRASVEKVISDFVFLDAEYGPFEHVYFMDANFFVDAKRAMAIAEGLARTKSKPTFSFSTRVNQIARASLLLPRLTELGLRAIELGIESASEAVLLRFSKDTTPRQNDAALCLLNDLGIQLIFDFIMFDAESTINDLQLNLSFLERHGLDSYIPWDHLFSWLTPYHGTPIRHRYESMGMKLPIHELPMPEELFVDPKVRHVFLEMERFGKFLHRLKLAILRTDKTVREVGIDHQEGARAALNAVTLRRIPFRLLSNLITAAAHGDVPRFETALPKFYSDDRTVLSLEEFLDGLA